MNPIEIVISAKDQASTALKGVGDTLKKTFDGVNASVGGFTAGMGKIAGGVALAQVGIAAITTAISKLNSTFIEYNANMEQSAVSFETFLGSAEAAQVFILDLKRMADTTPFEFPQLQNSAKKLLAFGYAAKDIVPIMTSLGDAAAGLSVGAEGIDRMVLALGQMRAKGKVSGEEIMQLNELGINAAKILKDTFGMSVEQIQKSGKNIDEVITALIDGIGAKYKGLMDKQSKTFTGLLSTVKDQTGTILGFLGTPIFEAAKSALEKIAEAFGNLTKIINEGDYAKFLDMFSPEMQAMIEQTYDIWVRFEPTFNQIYDAGKKVVSTFADIAAAVLGTSGEGWLMIGIGLLDAFCTGLEAIVATTEWVGEKIGEWSLDIETYLDETVEFFDTAWESIKIGITDTFSKIFDYPLQKIREFATEAKYTLKGILDMIPGMETQDPGTVEAGPGPYSNQWNEIFDVVDASDDSDLLSLLDYTGNVNSEGTAGDGKSALRKRLEAKKAERDAKLKKGREDLAKNKGEAAVGPDMDSKAAGKIDKISDKVAEAFDSLNQKIMGETGTTYQLGLAKINDEIAKMQREFIADAAEYGIDTTALQAKLDEYGNVMKEGLLRDQQEALKSVQNETALIGAKLIDNKRAEAEIEYQITVDKLAKERREKLKTIAQDTKDKEALAALDAYINGKMAEAKKKLNEETRKSEIEKYDQLVELYGLEYDLHLRTEGEKNQLSRDSLDKKIQYLNEELAKEGLTVTQIIELRKQLKDAKDQAAQLPTTASEAFQSGMASQLKSWGSYFDDIRKIGEAAAQGLNTAFSDFFFDAMTGQLKSLGDYFKSFLQGIARAIANMMANAFATKIINALFPNMFGKAVGGPVNYGQTYLVGERGPELFVPQSAGSIVPNHAIGAAGNNVTVNVINNSGTPVKATQEAKIDARGYIVNVVLEAYANNIGGMRDAFAMGRA